MKTYVKFNLNHYVKFRLSPYSKIRSKLDLKELEGKMQDDGYYRLQMWEFVQMFGNHYYHGSLPPTEMNVLVEVELEGP